jgi:hypothetical protein
MGRDPATGEAIKIKASKKIAFGPAGTEGGRETEVYQCDFELWAVPATHPEQSQGNFHAIVEMMAMAASTGWREKLCYAGSH